MKFKFIQSNEKEEVNVYAKSRSDLINEIEIMCENDSIKLIGYKDNIFKDLSPNKIECFYTLKDKVYAIYDNESYLIKKRLYEIYDLYNDYFVYINQGCLASLKHVDRFDLSFSGTILVIFKSGYKDYVSRRMMKKIKERIGLK